MRRVPGITSAAAIAVAAALVALDPFGLMSGTSVAHASAQSVAMGVQGSAAGASAACPACAPFLVGFGFSANDPNVSGLSVTFDAVGTPGVVEVCQVAGGCAQEPYDLRALMRMHDDTGLTTATFAIGPFDSVGEHFVRSFVPLDGPDTWVPLEDGIVEVQIDPLDPEPGPGETVSIVTSATMDLVMEFEVRSGPLSIPALPTWGTLLLAGVLLACAAAVFYLAVRHPATETA